MQRGLTKKDFYLFKGVNAYGEDNRIPADAMYYAENCRFEGFRLGNRKGFQAFGDIFTGGTNIKGLINYNRYPSGVSKEYVLAYYNSIFERVDTETITSTQITPTGWTAGDVSVEGLSYRGNAYVCNGTDLIGKIDDTTFSTVTDGPRACFLETWLEKMWAVDNTAPATVQYTRTATAANPEYIEDWTTVGAAGAELLGSGGQIVALRKLGTKLYAFKNNGIEEFYGIDLSGTTPVVQHRPLAVISGATSQKSTVLVENDLWFLTPDLEIRRLGQEINYTQESPRTRDISNVLNRYKNQLDPDQSGAVATYHKGLYKLSLKTLNSAQNDLKFVYDYNTGFWDFDKDTSQSFYCVADGQQFFSTDGNNGQLYKDNTGYSDNGQPMSWDAVTSIGDDGSPDVAKYARYLYIRGARSEGVAITAYLLGEDRERLETFSIPVPTSTEIAAKSTTVEDAWKQVGDDQVGGEGFNGPYDEGSPEVYRFNMTFSCASTSRMFGIEFESSLNGQRVFIDEAKIKYIPRGESYYNITA